MARKKTSPQLTDDITSKKDNQPDEKTAGKTNTSQEESTPVNEEAKPARKKAAAKKAAAQEETPSAEGKPAPVKKSKKSAPKAPEPQLPLPEPDKAAAPEAAELKPAKKAAPKRAKAARKKAQPAVTSEEPVAPAAAEVTEKMEPVPLSEEKNEEAVHRLADVGKHATEEAKEQQAVAEEQTTELPVTETPEATPVNQSGETAEPVLPLPVVKKLTFILNYYTKPGQNLFITAEHPLFGNGNPEAALPMHFADADHWKAEITLEEITGELRYSYLLKEEDGSVVYDGGKDKKICPNDYTKNNIVVFDSWDFAGYYDNAFFTEPFKNVLLKGGHTPSQHTEPVAYTHQMKIKAPLVNAGQVVCITGSTDALKNWNTDEPFLLSKSAEEDYWHIKLDLTGVSFPLEYKYGVFNPNTQQLVSLEEGANRQLPYTESSVETIVNDGFLRTADNTWKGAGVAIPVFSIRTEDSWGSGEFTDIKKLVDWSKMAGLKLIQLLPVNDTTVTKTWRDSYPYSAISAFALHPMYLNVEEMTSEENKHLLQSYTAEARRLNALPSLDYQSVNDIKWKVIHDIYPLQKEATLSSADYKAFFEDNKHWLVPYAAFCSLRDTFNTADFTKWNEYRVYTAGSVDKLMQSPEEADRAGMYYFVQYHLHLQLKAAAEYAHRNGIIIKGDIAIGISRNSADAWQEPDLYNMDMQAGAPPDAFAVKGQNWSFPTYNWTRMKEDGFAWWKRRFSQMSNYFDAFRIDHILGFFRIWSIPVESVEGIMGHFVPALPVHINEFHQWHINFDYKRFCKPFINDQILNDIFGDQQGYVKDTFLVWEEGGTYHLKPEVATQKRVETYFGIRDENEHNKWLKQCLFDLISNIILFEEEGSNGLLFHFRFGMEKTLSYQYLDDYTKRQLYFLSINYFYERQNEFWRYEAMQKLPALKAETDMLICGEDLGMVPASVPRVMQELGLLSLEVQRMPKDERASFTNLAAAPYLSVVTPSTHDMSTVRGWWEEDKETTQKFYNNQLGQVGEAPQFCEPWINRQIVEQHLYSPAMWSIFQLQDLLGIDGNLRRSNPNEERINVPAIPNYYWQYRIHMTIEDLMKEDGFTGDIKQMVTASGR